MDGKLNPDNMIDRITAKSWTSKDLGELVGTLEKASPETLKDLKAGVLKHIANKAKVGKTLNEVDDYIVSGANLLKEIERIGKPKLRAILGEKDGMNLLRFAKFANRFTNKVPGTYNPSGTAGRIEQMVIRGFKSCKGCQGLTVNRQHCRWLDKRLSQ